MLWQLKRKLRLQHRLSPVLLLGVVLLIVWKYYPSSADSEASHPVPGGRGASDQEYPKTESSYSWDTNGFTITRDSEQVLKGILGVTYGRLPQTPQPCHGHSKCSVWAGRGHISVREYSHRGAQCYDILSSSVNNNNNPMDCYEILDTHWYGGAETYQDRWPIRMSVAERPHVSETGSYGSVLERYWFSSRGVGIFVEDLVPLFIKSDNTKFCLIAKYDGNTYRNWDDQFAYLNYTICVRDNIKKLHTYMLDRYIANPIGIPDEKMIKYPVWSTWAKYKSYITQQLTEQFTNEIADHGFRASSIELDDIYTVNYGDYAFDRKKFPNPEAMIGHIHSKGFRITVWTHPFANVGTESYSQGDALGYWVMDDSGAKTGRAGWWRGHGGVLDVTNKQAVDWYFSRMDKIHRLGVDGHKYDAGEIGFLPPRFKTKKVLKNPCHYSTMYAEAMYNNTNRYMQVRVGYKTQHLPIFVSMMDRASDWGYNMGLKSLITTSLVFGSMGYYFIMPDMIGGNAYCAGNMDCNDAKPERELFIRWLQLNAFLPMMQFSFTPWQYDDEVVRIAKKYVDLHADYVAPRIIELGKQSMKTGHPIIRPMWWVSPDDKTSHIIDSQFMVGDDLLVAPIMDKATTRRDVYLPKGTWKNVITDLVHKVTTDAFYLKGVKAELDQIPYFERIKMQ